jgi:hypothetical protein
VAIVGGCDAIHGAYDVLTLPWFASSRIVCAPVTM